MSISYSPTNNPEQSLETTIHSDALLVVVFMQSRNTHVYCDQNRAKEQANAMNG